MALLKRYSRVFSMVAFATIIYALAAQGSQSLSPSHKRIVRRAIACLIPASKPDRPKEQLIASWQVPLKPDTSETTNVLVAAKAIDGITIPKQTVFSFNHTVGPRTANKGYVSGAMFENGQVVIGLGGGVCIVSTALYNAVLEAGLPIIMRSPHSGIVRYAPPGRDAAVASDTDFQFKNDTDSDITIHADSACDTLTISIYGTRLPGYQVQVLTNDYRTLPGAQTTLQDPTLQGFEPATAQTCQDGYECTIVRKVIKNGRLVRRDEISHDVHPARDGLTIAPMDAPAEPGDPDAAQDIASPAPKPEPQHPLASRDTNAAKAAVAGAVMRSLFAQTQSH